MRRIAYTDRYFILDAVVPFAFRMRLRRLQLIGIGNLAIADGGDRQYPLARIDGYAARRNIRAAALIKGKLNAANRQCCGFTMGPYRKRAACDFFVCGSFRTSWQT